MEENAFSSLALVHLPTPARVLRSSWCPDKDLLVVVTRLGGKDRVSLWKMHGAKKWEVGFDANSTASSDEVVDICWSPDTQTIAIAHNPPRVTLHSIQDGHEERVLPVSLPLHLKPLRPVRLSNIWWLAREKQQTYSSIPDIFQRGNDITGSAHSILKGQPLLDPLQDESQPLTATDLFAFQGSQTRAVPPSVPPVISSWPALPSDSLAASIQPQKLSGNQLRPGEELDEADDANVDSILMVSDDTGHLHCFLDGSYPLGSAFTGIEALTVSIYKEKDCFFAHPQFIRVGKPSFTSLRPWVIRLPEIQRRTMRDVARVSSSTRELNWYAMRVVKDMRNAWFGSETQNGARELGPKWVRALEDRQRDEFGHDEPYAMVDLTSLLATGRLTESFADYLGSGEQMSDRGLQKWESTMVESLIKLRDYAEKRVAPACQRVHLLLEEVAGWSQLSQYENCKLNISQINGCLDLASRTIVLASWLAATTRKELVRFKEFMKWLKYETTRANTPSESTSLPAPKHDILEVNDYLMAGLVVSPIDKWFMGPVPQFATRDLGVPGDQHDLKAVMQRARGVLSNQQQTAWQSNIKQKDLSYLDRNLDSLIQELATRCQRIFVEAAGATGRSAVVVSSSTPAQVHDTTLLRAAESRPSPLIRERTIADSTQAGTFTQTLAIQIPRDANKSDLCLARLRFAKDTASSPLSADIAVMECCAPNGDAEYNAVPFTLLDADFFDDSVILLVYRFQERPGPASIATVGYSDLHYETVELQAHVSDFAREALMLEVLLRLSDGRLSSVPAPIIQSRTLSGCKEGNAFLAANGRAGRRVACVLDGAGLALEILDMEGEVEDLEEMSTVEA